MTKINKALARALQEDDAKQLAELDKVQASCGEDTALIDDILAGCRKLLAEMKGQKNGELP